MTTTNDELREALALGLEYVKDELLSHDNLYDDHPAGKAGRVLLVDHACQIEAALATLAQQAAPTVPNGSLQEFQAMAQGATDYDVPVANINGMMTIMATTEAVYITREQAAAFFGFSASPAAPEAAPQQQAQEEPEVVAYRTRLHRMSGAEYWGYNERNPFPGLPNSGQPLITLQSHREAIALKDAEIAKLRAALGHVCNENQGLLNAIFRKDAALAICVSALESCDAQHISDGGRQWFDEKLVDAAITQAKGAMK